MPRKCENIKCPDCGDVLENGEIYLEGRKYCGQCRRCWKCNYEEHEGDRPKLFSYNITLTRKEIDIILFALETTKMEKGKKLSVKLKSEVDVHCSELQEYPILHSMVKQMAIDNECQANPNFPIPIEWHDRFSRAEKVAVKIEGKKVKDIDPGNLDRYIDNKYVSDMLATTILTIGNIMNMRLIIDKLGIEGDVIEKVLSELFDGELKGAMGK